MASCPNINFKTDPSQEKSDWEMLVDQVGELHAYYVFSKNGYNIPTLDEDGNFSIEDGSSVEELDMSIKDESDATFLRNMTKTRNKILNSLLTKYNIYEGSKKEESIEKLKKLIHDFENADLTKSLFIYVANINSQVDKLIEKMEEPASRKSPGLLKRLHDYAGTFDMIQDISKYIEGRDDIKPIYKKRVAEALGKVEGFNKKYLAYSKDAIIDTLANESTLVRSRYKERYAREYRENNPRSATSLTKDEYKIEERKYVKNMMNSNASKILREEKRNLRDMMDLSQDDISAFTRLAIDPKGVNEHFIQLTTQMLDRADRNANQRFIESRADALSVWEKFKQGFGQSITATNQKKLYDGIIEKIDGKETRYYVREYYSTYYDGLNEYNRERRAAETPEERRALKEKFKKEFPDSKYKNPQFVELMADTRKREMYQFLINFNKESDNIVPPGAKLGYRLPSVSKTASEKITDNGIIKAAKKEIAETVKIQQDDERFGELTEDEKGIKLITDEKGQVLKRVMIPFRNKIEPEDQSYDLMGMALKNRFVSYNYQEKNSIKINLEILSNIMKERDVIKRKGKRQVLGKVKDLFGVEKDEAMEVVEKGINSESFKLMEGILEDRLYGRKMVKSDLKIFGMDVDKLTDAAIQFSSNNMLIANYMGGGANTLAGKVMNFFEGTRGKFYTRKDLRTAEKKYIGDFKGWGGDIGRVGAPRGKTNMLIEKFIDTSMDFSGFSSQLTKDSRFKEMFSMGTLHSINNAAEHYIHGTVVYAMLNNTKVVDEFGNFLDKDGNITTDRNKAMSLDEAYDIVDNKLVLRNPKWKIENYEDASDIEFIVSRKLKEVVKDLHGNYDENNKAQMQRYWYGKLGFFLRKWMIPGVQRRWRGIDTLSDERDFEDRAMYSEATHEFKEGTYTTAVRYLNEIRKQGAYIQAEVYSKEWNKLSDTEKGNIRNATIELGVMVTCLTASILLAEAARGAEDEGDEETLWKLAYLMRRQYGELLFFTPFNPSEAARMMRTPSATISSAELAVKTVTQLGEDFFGLTIGEEAELYEAGKNKGEYKSWVLMNKLFNPFYKQLVSKDVKESYEYLTNIRQ